jgi:hypothetical protein
MKDENVFRKTLIRALILVDILKPNYMLSQQLEHVRSRVVDDTRSSEKII